MQKLPLVKIGILRTTPGEHPVKYYKNMTYQDTIEYLFNSAPLFQQIGGAAYKEGLENTRALDAHFGHPHRRFRTIHIAGTNGKGSCSHTLAAILQTAGYRTGLYTSPHLLDFRERIRVNGRPIPEECVVRFVEQERAFFEPLHPSFFELTTALAFRHFADEEVDVAVVEVGLGGRLDCTNIIHPDACLITNISFDHTQYLGDSLPQIAAEKAGIIKAGVPVVIGETLPDTRPVFAQKAAEVGAPIHFAQEETHDAYPGLVCQLQGSYQQRNIRSILALVAVLRGQGYRLDEQSVRGGFAHVCDLTGLMGRWQKLHDRPTLVCDTGHNLGGMQYVGTQLRNQTCRRMHIVLGMSGDKQHREMLECLPREADYYFTQASVKRALPAEALRQMAAPLGMKGECYPDVASAVRAAQEKSLPEDFIFVGGSNFVVADLLANRDALNLH